MAVVGVEGLTKRFGKLIAVDGLSFELKEGSVTGFLGRKWGGKDHYPSDAPGVG